MDTRSLASHFPHFFAYSANQGTPGYGDPAQLADHMKPRYPDIPEHAPAHIQDLFEAVHRNTMRGFLTARDVATITRHLRTADSEIRARTMPLAALTLITAEDVRAHNTGGEHEADRIVSHVLKLLRHHLGAQPTSFTEKAAAFLFARKQCRHANFAPLSPSEECSLQQTLMNALIGLSFQARHLDQACVDRNINAFYDVLTRAHARERLGLGGRFDVQARVVELMLTLGIDPRMGKCKSHALNWIRWWRFRNVSPDVGFDLAKACVRYLNHYASDGLPYDFANIDKDFLGRLTNDQRKALREDIEAVLDKETNPIITRPMNALISVIVSMNMRAALSL